MSSKCNQLKCYSPKPYWNKWRANSSDRLHGNQYYQSRSRSPYVDRDRLHDSIKTKDDYLQHPYYDRRSTTKIKETQTEEELEHQWWDDATKRKPSSDVESVSNNEFTITPVKRSKFGMIFRLIIYLNKFYSE